jgi:hypothetical protein
MQEEEELLEQIKINIINLNFGKRKWIYLNLFKKDISIYRNLQYKNNSIIDHSLNE